MATRGRPVADGNELGDQTTVAVSRTVAMLMKMIMRNADKRMVDALDIYFEQNEPELFEKAKSLAQRDLELRRAIDLTMPLSDPVKE